MKAEGKCWFCDKTYKKAGINRHLKTHLEEKTVEKQPGKSYLLKIVPSDAYGKTPHFLSLWINGETTFEYLDDYLRDIWLECCGHMSAFQNPKKRRNGGMFGFFETQDLLEMGKVDEYEELMEETTGEVPKSRKAKDELSKGLKLTYEYDFGSTTELSLTVLEEYPIKADKPLVLLSRNEPPKQTCGVCGKKPAVSICSVCMYDWGKPSLFCGKCAKEHAKTCEDFGDYASMPFVNSPRAGVCGYEGGTIDTKRDGNS